MCFHMFYVRTFTGLPWAWFDLRVLFWLVPKLMSRNFYHNVLMLPSYWLYGYNITCLLHR